MAEPAHEHAHAESQGHGHAHAHGAAAGPRALRWALAITVTVLVAEAIGGWWTGSVALLGDAGHMLTDAAALSIALFASWLASRPRDARRSFGYGRTEILGALANGLLLGGISITIGIESVSRLSHPEPIIAGPMIAIAVGGLAANLLCARILHGSGDDMNMRAARWHVLSDALGSVGAIVAGLAALAGFYRADALAGLAIAVLILTGAFRLVRDSVDVLLEGAPSHLDLEQIAAEVAQVPGVAAVHDLHIWTVASGFLAMSAHVDMERAAEHSEVRRRVHELLHRQYAVAHTTIQTEEPPPLLSIEPPAPLEPTGGAVGD